MNAVPVILIFDIGKTNKKCLLFDESYNLVFETMEQLLEVQDEDGFMGEDLIQLKNWIHQSFEQIVQNKTYDIKAINFSAYGASFVFLDEANAEILPLYNYLKPLHQEIQSPFYARYGGAQQLSMETASPVLGNLNSGMQLYRLKKEQPNKFELIKTALHLPQFLSFLFTKKIVTDITSLGCHTLLWNYNSNNYHKWVQQEGVLKKLAPLQKSDEVMETFFPAHHKHIKIGIGLHDSSAALVPYIHSFQEPYILISTGTWSISLNPFNQSPLTNQELMQDCLCYMSYQGTPIKASRLFAGNEHEQAIKKLAANYNQALDDYKKIKFNTVIYKKIIELSEQILSENELLAQPIAANKISNIIPLKQVLSEAFNKLSYEEAYHAILFNIIQQQVISTNLVLNNTEVNQIFVDGGFSNNSVFMHFLAAAYPNKKVFAATLSQASSLGAAMAIHSHWNTQAIPHQLIQLKQYLFN